jgi:hypothetical protein
MSTPVAPAAAPAEVFAPAPAPTSLVSRIADTFIAPTRAFEQLRDGPAPWVGAVLVVAAVALAATVVQALLFSPHELGEFALQQMGPGAARLTADQVAQMEGGMRVRMLIGAAFTVPAAFIEAGFFGLLLTGIWGLLLGGRAQVRPYVAVAAHAMLVGAFGVVVTTAFVAAAHQLGLSLSAALLFPSLDPDGVAHHVLGSITPFGLWMVWLLAFGGAVVNRRKGWAGAFAMLFGLQMAVVTGWALFLNLLHARASAGS